MKASIWDFWADKYNRLWVQKYSLGPTRKQVIAAFCSVLQSGAAYRILDVGCGTGQLIADIRAAFPSVQISFVGVDISPRMIAVAAARNPEDSFQVSSIESFAAEAGTFDVVLCTHSFPYYSDKPGVLQKLSRLLIPGGRLLLAQASVNSLYDALVMFCVKLTTSKADYPSIAAVKAMGAPYFAAITSRVIRERLYMPTIALFVCRKGSEVTDASIAD